MLCDCMVGFFKDLINLMENISKPVSTQAHWKYMPQNIFLQHCCHVPYCTFRGSFKVKRPVSGAKTRVQYVTLARVNKCKTGIKTYLLMQLRHLIFLICSFELFCGTVVSQDLYPSPLPLKSNLLNIKTHTYKAGYVTKTFKSIHF